MKITNNTGISLPLAVWLLHDEYDYINEKNYISATSLLKSTKQLILSRRVPLEDREIDVADLLSSRFGHAIHDSIEKAWKASGKTNMKRLGYPDHIVDSILIDPTPEEIAANPDAIKVLMETRAFREIKIGDKTYKVGGKFDMIIDGRLFDFKTTSVYSYISGDKDEDYSKQGSIYRWLNPEEITSEHIFIQFLFTDWQKMMARNNPNYPQSKYQEHPVELLSLQDTEQFIYDKLVELSRFWDAPEDKIPPCNDKELWRSDPKYKYYSDPTKTDGRSTKNFDNLKEGTDYWKKEKAGKGILITVPGEVKACAYCAAYNNCEQRKQYDV